MVATIPAWPQPRHARVSVRRVIAALLASVVVITWAHRQVADPAPGTVDYCHEAGQEQVEHGTPMPDTCTGAFGG